MITNFVKISLKDETIQASIQSKILTQKSIVLSYPCQNPHVCTPYVLELSKGVYKFECWGSQAQFWPGGSKNSQPGLGAYTAGTLFIPKPTTFFVYIGNVGLFNAVKEKTSINIYTTLNPGGATDVRLNYSVNWWDEYSTISRIIVAAGGGSAEWAYSVGGNGGTIEGGQSLSATSSYDPSFFDPCPGAKQTKGSECPGLPFQRSYYYSAQGTFGSAGRPQPTYPNGNEDYGGFGGGGYYGGTSYQYAFAGSGGSSFISGHEGCDAVKEQIEIEHTGLPYHYSGFVFSDTKMISGHEQMPLPNSTTEEGIYADAGAFRITLVMYNCKCTHKRLLSSFFFQIYLSSFISQ